MDHVKKIAAQSKQNIFFIQGKTAKGLECYYYILAKPGKAQALENFTPGGRLKIDDIGTVLEKGYGEPSEQVKQAMSDQYGFISA